jgi:hypothetical protein
MSKGILEWYGTTFWNLLKFWNLIEIDLGRTMLIVELPSKCTVHRLVPWGLNLLVHLLERMRSALNCPHLTL